MGLDQLNPVLQWLLGAGAIGIIFNAGVTYANFSYIRKSMVTKKDLEIALLREEQKCDAKYATKVELHNVTRGKSQAASAGRQSQ
jgi:hypothetical protein